VKATRWEFENRAVIIGLVFAAAFLCSSLDARNAAVALAEPLAASLHVDGYRAARAIFALAAVSVALAAVMRTWASAYLAADVVYADRVKTASLVADGPYRFVRNPLYFANVLLTAGMGAMASRLGFVVLNGLMVLFSYRLILREEGELASAQGAAYADYRARVPRLFPALRPRMRSAGGHAHWANGIEAEAWCWGFAAAMAAFAATLSVALFFVVLSASIVTLWIVTSRLGKSRRP
jgi:protein-S-isoprenylcysteine O-methyltransferase Ste14